VSVPLKCVFNQGGRQIAYVATADGYDSRALALGARNDARVIVEGGLEEGEVVFAADLAQMESEGRSNGNGNGGSASAHMGQGGH
jgi:hypothetical protein